MRFISLLSVFLLLCTKTLLSQSNQYSIKHYDTETGLPQNSIKSAEMDCNGFIWFATEMGLVEAEPGQLVTVNLNSTEDPLQPLSATK